MGAVEAGVGGAVSGGGIGGGGDGLGVGEGGGGSEEAGLADDLCGEAVPGGRAGGGGVVDTSVLLEVRVRREDVGGERGEGSGGGGSAVLVGDDVEGLGGAGSVLG